MARGFIILTPPMILRASCRQAVRTPWVTQGITAIYATPKISTDYLADAGREVTQFFGNDVAGVVKGHVYTFIWEAKSNNRYDDVVSIKNFRNSFNIPKRYHNLKKLQCYPYSVVECSCLNGSNVIYRPEDIQSNDLTIRENVELRAAVSAPELLPGEL